MRQAAKYYVLKVAPFTPATLPNLAVWLDAADASSCRCDVFVVEII